MKVEKINQPTYKLTLSAFEMSQLWDMMYEAAHGHPVDRVRANKWCEVLEEVRPAGGFEQ